MVCLACLLPLFLVPIVNILPLIFDLIMIVWVGLSETGKSTPACPIKSSAIKIGTNNSVTGEGTVVALDPLPKPVEVDDCKRD